MLKSKVYRPKCPDFVDKWAILLITMGYFMLFFSKKTINTNLQKQKIKLLCTNYQALFPLKSQ